MIKDIKIKVIGVGGGGMNTVEHIYQNKIDGVDIAVVNTDSQALKKSTVSEKILIGRETTEGKGTGGVKEIGERAAIESLKAISYLIEGYDVIILVGSLGGGTGTGAIPVIAQLAEQLDILTFAVLSTPFSFEGKTRAKTAFNGLPEIARLVDSIFVITGGEFQMKLKNSTISSAFGKMDDALSSKIKVIISLMNRSGFSGINFHELKVALKKSKFSKHFHFVTNEFDQKSPGLMDILSFLGKEGINESFSILISVKAKSNQAALSCYSMLELKKLQFEFGNRVKLLNSINVNEEVGSDIIIDVVITNNEWEFVTSRDIESKAKANFFKTSDESVISLYFMEDEFSASEVAELISFISELYKDLGGDQIIIKGIEVFESSNVLQPVEI